MLFDTTSVIDRLPNTDLARTTHEKHHLVVKEALEFGSVRGYSDAWWTMCRPALVSPLTPVSIMIPQSHPVRVAGSVGSSSEIR